MLSAGDLPGVLIPRQNDNVFRVLIYSLLYYVFVAPPNECGGGAEGSKVYAACFLLGSAELHRQLLDQCSFCFSNSKVLIEIEDKQEIEKHNQHLG